MINLSSDYETVLLYPSEDAIPSEQYCKKQGDSQKPMGLIAHDFRTPLTALLLYLDILRKGQNSDDEKTRTYIEKAIEKGT